MSGFTEGALIKKLQDLNSSQQSIQTLSLWLIHHRKHHASAVKIWLKELLKAPDGKQLTFMYLANDVIQNSKKKGPEYGREFGEILKKSFQLMASTGIDEKTKNSLFRILNIWGERGVYSSKQIQEFKDIVDPSAAKEEAAVAVSKSKKRKTEDAAPTEDAKQAKRVPVIDLDVAVEPLRREKRMSETRVEVDGLMETHVTLSPKNPPGDPPEPEELIKALLELENSASSDAVVREKIASLPPEVSEVHLLTNLDNKEDALSLSEAVGSAVRLLAEYNARLSSELERRRGLAAALHDFAQAQHDLTRQAEQRLEEYNVKLQKVYAVRAEIKSHMESLPDVTQLPNVTTGLAPLPSAGDLFNLFPN